MGRNCAEVPHWRMVSRSLTAILAKRPRRSLAGDERTPLAADVSARMRGANPNDSTCVARYARPRHGATPPGCDTAVRGSGSCSVVWRQRSWTCSGTVTGSWPPVFFVEIQQWERRCCARCTVSLQESAAVAHRNGERAQGNSIAVPAWSWGVLWQ